MSLAATHILIPIILFEYLRDTFSAIRRFFSRKYVFLIGIAGIMPDMDLPIQTAIGIATGLDPVPQLGHRYLFHNLFIPFFLLLIFALLYWSAERLSSRTAGIGRKVRKSKASRTDRERTRKVASLFGKERSFAKIFLVLALGWLLHLTIDAVLTGSIMPFYPVSDYMADVDLVGIVSRLSGIEHLTIEVSIDALLLIFWLWHEHFTHKIVDFF